MSLVGPMGTTLPSEPETPKEPAPPQRDFGDELYEAGELLVRTVLYLLLYAVLVWALLFAFLIVPPLAIPDLSKSRIIP